MIDLDKKPYWVCPSGEQLTNFDFLAKAKTLILQESRVYVGTDSMLRGDCCIFATVIAFHNNEKNIATYYYKKFRVANIEYQNIKNKITEEVNLSVQAAQKISEISPLTNVEVHVDIGANKGEDSQYYLERGYEVVAFECNPSNIEFLKKRFENEIRSKAFILETKALVSGGGDHKKLKFYVDDKSVWGTINQNWAKRNSRLGSKIRSIEVETLDPKEIYFLINGY